MFESRDAGRSWRPLAHDRAGLLAWSDALWLVDGSGTVHESTDAGRNWSRVGAIGGRPAALAMHETELYVALHDNQIKVSHDRGRTWDLRTIP